MSTRTASTGEYEIFREVSGDHERTLLTSSRTKAVAEVKRLLDEGIDPTSIYATYDRGQNFGQARAHLLLPDQQ